MELVNLMVLMSMNNTSLDLKPVSCGNSILLVISLDSAVSEVCNPQRAEWLLQAVPNIPI